MNEVKKLMIRQVLRSRLVERGKHTASSPAFRPLERGKD